MKKFASENYQMYIYIYKDKCTDSQNYCKENCESKINFLSDQKGVFKQCNIFLLTCPSCVSGWEENTCNWPIVMLCL